MFQTGGEQELTDARGTYNIPISIIILDYLQNVYIYILDNKAFFVILKMRRIIILFVVSNTFVSPCRRKNMYYNTRDDNNKNNKRSFLSVNKKYENILATKIFLK